MTMAGALRAAAALLAMGAALLTLVCSVGVAAMRDPLQRLHFVAPPSTLCAAMLAIAIGLDAGPLAAVKPALVVVLLAALNGVVSHAIARAFFVRQHGAWPPGPPSDAPSQAEARGGGEHLDGEPGGGAP